MSESGAEAVSARNAGTGTAIADRVERAGSLKARLIGLLGRRSLEKGEALWLEPCAQVHTFFMAFPIDVVFLDRDRRVVRVVRDLVPWRVSPWVWGARSALELPAGAAQGRVQAGDKVEFRPI